MRDDGLPNDTIMLECGNLAYFDNTGYRCVACLAIWGSIGCGCSNELRRKEEKDGR